MLQAVVRQHIQKIAGVTRTWFEWTWEDSTWVKTLVVEVEFYTDPNEYEFRRSILDATEETARGVETTMIIGHLKVVPRLT
jgi:hypothetical protein